MKKILCMLAMMGMFAFAAAAQQTPSSSDQQNPSASSATSSQTNSQTTSTPDQTANPSSQSTTSSPDQSANPSSPDQNAAGAQTSTTTTTSQTTTTTKTKGEKSLTGCIQNNNGQFVLQEKNGKMAKLSSTEDLSAHVGHEVRLRGSWGSGSASSMGGMSSNPSSSSASGTQSASSATGTTGSESAAGTSNYPSGSSSASANPSGTSTTSSASGTASGLPQSDVNNPSSSNMSNVTWDHPDQSFQVSNVEMKSDHCRMKGNTNTSNTSTPPTQQ